MSTITERSLGYGFSLLGGILLLVAAFVSLVLGVADLALSRPFGALDSATMAIVLFVVGALALFFGYLARHDWRERPLASGILLIVVAVIGWGVLGLGTNVIALVGALFVFLSGVLFLVEPVKSGVSTAMTA